MQRADTDKPVKFIYSQAAAAAIDGKPDTWLLCEGARNGRLSLIRFNRDGKRETPVTLFLTKDGWKVNRKNNKTMPTLTFKHINETSMFAAQVLSVIKKKYPNLQLSNMRQPASHEQSTQLCYAKYHVQHVTQDLIPVTDKQCFLLDDTVAVKMVSEPKNIYTQARPNTVMFSKSLAKEPVPVPTEMVEQALGFIWTETNVLRPYHIHELRVRLEDAEALALNDEYYLLLNKKLEENRGKIGITYAGEEMGYVVVAMEDLPAQTLLTTYTGNLRPRSEIFVDGCRNSRYAMTYECRASDMLFALDAAQYRNFGAMIAHLPSASTIAKYAFQISKLDIDPETSKPDIATENVRILKYTYRHYPLAIMETSADVKKGDLLGFDYEMGYWHALGMTPSLFTRKGKPLNQAHYKANTITVHVINPQTKRKFFVEASFDTFIKNFQANHGYYLLKLDDNGEQIAIRGNEFLLKYNLNPRCLVMELTDCIDEYRLAFKNTFGLRK